MKFHFNKSWNNQKVKDSLRFNSGGFFYNFNLFDATKTTTNYSDVDVDTKSPLFSEPLQKLNLEDNDLHGFDRSKLPSTETRTKEIWVRESVLKKIIFANMLLKNTRNKNNKIVAEYGYVKNPER